jgi:hypothetical protein
MGVVALFVVGRAHLAIGQAQAAADTAAISAGHRLRELLPTMAAPEGRSREAWRGELAVAAGPSARVASARIVALRFPGVAWPPTEVEIEVERGGPMGTRVRAVARAGIRVSAPLLVAGPSGLARGGGYSGPLAYRDGKPMCPAVAAALDLMAPAARAEGAVLTVVSGFRTDAEQAVLFARHPDPRWVAPAGRSRHRDATELDFAGGPGLEWLARNAERFGFVQRYSWEPWHYGFVAGCGEGATANASPDQAELLVPGWVPLTYRGLVAEAAAASGIAPGLLAALLQAESGFNPRAISPAGALGIAQFMPGTARGMGLLDPFDPVQAIPAAARLLAGHIGAFGSPALALAAYNAGPGAVRASGGIPPYAETQAYVARVLALAGGGALLAGPGGGVVLIRAGEALV